MGKHRIDGPGVIGFIAAATAILVMAVLLYTVLPKTAQAQGADEDVVVPRDVLIEVGSRYREWLAVRDALIEALEKAQKEIRRLQSATNCS